MTEESRASFEMTIILPLDVLADKLARIEADLRRLNMRVSDFAHRSDNAELLALIDARRENLYETLDSIKALLSDPIRTNSRSNRKPYPELDD
jgi:hypothetical protein